MSTETSFYHVRTPNTMALNMSTTLDNDVLGDDCRVFSGETWKCETAVSVKRIACSLSITGCLFTIFIIVVFKKYKETSQRMIANLSAAALMVAISALLEDIVYAVDTLCKLQGALLTMLWWNCCLWSMAIALNLYFKLVFHVDISKYEKSLTAFCWAFPLLPTGAACIGDVWAPAGVWCWMKNDWRWRFGDWGIYRITSILIFIFIMIHMTIVMYRMRGRRLSFTNIQNSIKEDIRTLRIYPIIYVLVNTPPIVTRIQNAIIGIEQEGHVFPLLLIHAICDPSFGAVIALVYVLDRRTRQMLTLTHCREAVQKMSLSSSVIKEYSLSETVSNV